MPDIETFRAVSGSTTVYFQTGDVPPSPADELVTISDNFSTEGLRYNDNDVLWEWNGVDTSQFDISAAYIGAPGTTTTLSVETDPFHTSYTGNVLVISASSPGNLAVWLATSSLDTNRYHIECHIAEVSPNNDGWGGVAYFCEGTGSDFHGFGGVGSTFGTYKGFMVDNGLVDPTVQTRTGHYPPVISKTEIIAPDRTVMTGSPYFVALTDIHGASNVAVSYQTTEGAAERTAWTNLPTGSSWENSTLRRFGLAISGSATSAEVKIYSLVIRKHALDL